MVANPVSENQQTTNLQKIRRAAQDLQRLAAPLVHTGGIALAFAAAFYLEGQGFALPPSLIAAAPWFPALVETVGGDLLADLIKSLSAGKDDVLTPDKLQAKLISALEGYDSGQVLSEEQYYHACRILDQRANQRHQAITIQLNRIEDGVEALQPSTAADTQSHLSPSHRAQLREFITLHFSQDELKIVCYDLDIDPEYLSPLLPTMVVDLLRHSERRGLMHSLVSRLVRDRSHPFLLDLLSRLPPKNPRQRIGFLVPSDLRPRAEQLLAQVAPKLGMDPDEFVFFETDW